MKSIDIDIKNGNIKHIYLLMGVEGYLIKQYAQKIKNALIPQDDNMNYKKYQGEDIDVNDLIAYADTMPFFAERRVIIVEDARLFKGANDKLADYIANVPETTYIIFTESYTGDRSDERKYEKTLVDKRLKLYKAVHEHGRIIEFLRQPEEVLTRWLMRRVDAAGLKITNRAFACLYEYVGNDMTDLSNEMEKLICYRMGKESIDIEHVREICTRNLSNDIFEMVSAIATKNKKKALELYYDLIGLKESPMKILYLLAREFNLLLQVKTIKAAGYGTEEVKKTTGINPYFVGRYIACAGKFTYDYLKNAVEDCVDTEAMFKQGMINDVMGVEMLIIKYAT